MAGVSGESGLKKMTVVLGSRSPRRKELLESLLPVGSVLILPPSTADEPGFADCHTDEVVNRRLREIVELKHSDVVAQRNRSATTRRQSDGSEPPETDVVILVADTTVVATNNGGDRVVLGQPGGENWRDEVRQWLTTYLSGRTHSVRTCFRASCGARMVEQIVETDVTFARLTTEWVEWYVATEEPLGKAGGYAIQGAGAALVTRLEGSLTNVIGLPLQEVRAALASLAKGEG